MFQLFGPGRRLRKLIRTRAIFKYHDGERTRYGDPFAIWRTLTQDPVINLERIQPDIDKGKEPETSQFIALVRKAFDVKPFDEATGTGLTDWQTMELVGLLRDYTVAVKKNSSPGPTSPASTESASSTGPAAPSEPTNSSGDSTSTSPGSVPGGPTSP
jgi:hypothetical protein